MAKDIFYTRSLYLFSICGVYLAAFTSLYLQIPGLYGENGILPAHTQMESAKSLKECLLGRKTLLCFSTVLGLNTSYMMELISLTGIFLSLVGLIWESWCTAPLFAVLWAFYLSLYQVGQTFLWFQWDSLLLEAGFLTIIVSPLTWTSKKKCSPRNLVTMWLVRWAFFRLMFASGVVKLQSGCPTWWGLTALHVHYESQCIPTPLAWYAHHLPGWIHKLGVASALIIEIPVTFLFFSPVRAHRMFAFYAQVLLQVLIILTGNYNFFNLLTITLSLSLLDDGNVGSRYERKSTGYLWYIKTTINTAAKWIGFSVLAYYCFICFFKISPSGGLDTKINFTPEKFDVWMSKAVPLTIAIGAISLMLTIAEALTSSLFEMKGSLQKMASFISTLFYSHIVILLFGISLVPYSVLHTSTRQSVMPLFRDMYSYSSDLHLSSAYGLFRHMTGVGGRPEVVLEGSNNLNGPWIEYEFPYKPGKLDKVPPFLAPHQPRVDWQLWFAALGNYKQNPWFLSMTYRLLQGEERVTNFLARSSPWRQKPPKYIRAKKYLYHYTSFNSSSPNWWKRDSSEEYMPTFSVDHAPLLEFLRNVQILGTRDTPVKNKLLARVLDMIRDALNVLENHFTIFSLFVAAFVVGYTKKRFNY